MLETLYGSRWAHSVAAKYGAHQNDIEDICQSVAVKCLTQSRACEPGKERAYLRKAIRSCVVDHYRVRRRFPLVAEIMEDDTPVTRAHSRPPFDDFEIVDMRLDLPIFLDQLPRKERDAVQRCLEGLSSLGMATDEGVPVPTIKRRVNRGIAKIRALADAV